MIKKAGFLNLLDRARYPEIDLEEIVHLNPDYLLLSSEPYPFKEKHISFFQEKLPNAKIRMVDGEMFSWYGSRLIYAGEYFSTL
jgi:ABC-type Fe3+-hydroxamate transport system substrate-binding protein